MMITTHNLKNQGKIKFAELFERIYPHGTDVSKMQTLRDCKSAVRSRIYAFECNEKFRIRCRCDNCMEDTYAQVWDIAEALLAQNAVDCSCGDGSLTPMYRTRSA